MLSLCANVLLVLMVFPSATQTLEPPRVQDCSTEKSLDLSMKPDAQSFTVCVTPEVPTTFVFDSPLLSDAVAVQPVTPSLDVAQGVGFVTVYPKRSFLPGERVKITVRFADGAAPLSESFWLMGHPARGTRRIEVLRHPRMADALERQAAQAQSEARSCQEQKARLLIEREIPSTLMGVAWLDQEAPITQGDVFASLVQYPGNSLLANRAVEYVSASQTVLALALLNLGSESWSATGAVLTSREGDEVELRVWQAAVIPPDSGEGSVFMSVEKPPVQLGCPCVLKLWDSQGGRAVTLGNVTLQNLQPVSTGRL